MLLCNSLTKVFYNQELQSVVDQTLKACLTPQMMQKSIYVLSTDYKVMEIQAAFMQTLGLFIHLHSGQ